jgi:DNA-binding LytR/AlgR family response regulator
LSIKLRCLLLDDELPGLAYLKMLCQQIPALDVVKTFNNPQTLLAEAPNLEFDLCILDVEMPGINGLEVARLLKDKPVIFTTAYKEYASDAFDLDAVDYVKKPVQKERLEQAVEKAVKRISVRSTGRSFIQLNTDKGKAIVFFDQLMYIRSSETDSRDKIALLADGSELTMKNISFEKLQSSLPSEDFARINKGEIVAIKAIQTFSSDQITTNIANASGSQIRLSLSEIYRKELVAKMGGMDGR